MRACLFLLAPLALLALGGCARGSDAPAVEPVQPAFVQAPSPEEAGRYLFLMGGCNDCHTPGWAESGGKLPEADWALGSTIGYRGAWGTSYAENLRLSAKEFTESQWVQLFRRGDGPPPMPWQNYRDASESDLVAIQRFLRSLGALGVPAHDLVPPGTEPTTPYIDMTPKGVTPRGR